MNQYQDAYRTKLLELESQSLRPSISERLADYADSFKVLEKHGVVKADDGMKLRQMAKFRNRLVHLYGDIDDTHVHDFILNRLYDIVNFQAAIASRFLSAGR